jgi:hypothetical protein
MIVSTIVSPFKPWRNGKDLKDDSESLDDAFTSFDFTSKQQKIIDNFDVCYECLDARDDFSTQLKNGETSGFFPQFMSSTVLSDLDDDQHQDGAEFVNNIESLDMDHYLDSDKYTELGNHGFKIKSQMDATEHMIKDVGWLDKCPDGDINC